MSEIIAAICDDEPMALNMVASALVTCFAQNGAELRLEKYTSPEAFLKKIPDNAWQVVFLDIEMPGIDGIELGKRLKARKEQVDIIYISNCENRVFDAFAAQPFGFVRKSSFLKDVESVAKLYISKMKKHDSEEMLKIRTKGDLIQIRINSITYVECSRDTQTIYTSDRKGGIPVLLRMKVLEENLEKYGFLRVHTGYLVNSRFIKRIGEDSVQLLDDTTVPLSRRRKKDVILEYMRLNRSDQSRGVNLM